MALLPLYLLIKQDLGLTSDGQVTFLMTVLWLSYCVASYPLGILADRLNRKMLLAAGLALNGLAFVGLAQAPSYEWMIAWCAMAGFGGSFYHPAATAMLADLFPAETGKAIGRVGIGAAIGFWIAPTYAGWRGAAAGWRAPVMELGVLGIVAAILFVFLAPRGNTSHSEHKPANQPSAPLPGIRFWSIIVAISLFFSLRDFGGAGMHTLSSLFLQHAWHFDPKTTGQILGAMLLAAAVSNPLFGAWSDRHRLRLLCLVLGIAAVTVAAMPWLPKAAVVASLIVYGFFFLAGYPIVESALMESVPVHVRGKVFGLFISVSGVIASTSHWVIGDWTHALKSHQASAFVPLFTTLALLIILSLGGAFLLNAVRKSSSAHANPTT